MYDRILLPTDGTENTEQAIEEAIDLANTHGATLHTLYVIHSSAIAPGIDFDDLETIGRQAVTYVEKRATEAGVSVVETEVTHGLRHQAILDYTDDNDIDLIVIGRHKSLDHLVRTSLSKRVSSEANVPVLVAE